jgi:hypothetical protein
MAIFPQLELEEVVQVGDKTRLDGSKSFISKGENPVTLVRIKPEAAGSFITVTGASAKDWFLDWVYLTAGIKTATIEITTDTTPTSSPVTTSQNFTVDVVTAVDDNLFSNDDDLELHEPEIMKYVRAGRATFLNIHRRARNLIVAHMDDNGWVDANGDKLTLDAFVDITEAKEWSTFIALRLIFEGMSNKIDDVFNNKAKLYKSMELEARNRVVVRLDLDGDGSIDNSEVLPVTSPRLVRQ